MDGQPHARDHAVVIGASMGGLSAAAALATHYERVTVIDRDGLPSDPAQRRGVPQGKHAHGFQPGGLTALDALLPGLAEELRADGVPAGDLNAQCSWTVGGNRLQRATSGLTGIGVTRPFLEHRVRTRVAALPGVTFLEHTEVLAPISTDAGRRVVGVTVAQGGGGVEKRIAADLVVDATGKVSKLPQWLAALGFATPREETVECGMAYLSRRWRLAEGRTADLVTVVTPAQNPHFGVMIAQEDGTHIVTLGGLLDSGPARTDDAYLAFAARLADPVISRALVDAVPVTDLQPSHFPASRRRRYDRLRDFPQGLLAIADAIAAFNPMYGQGMSVAALEAIALRDHLAAGPLDARKFFATAHKIEDAAWKISTGGDLRYDGVVGRRGPDVKIMNRYLDRLTRKARTDAVLSDKFLRVAGFIDRPESLLAPSVMRRVLFGRGRPVQTAQVPSIAVTVPSSTTP